MKAIREWMRDPRAAGLLGGVAVLLVGYRLYTTVAGNPEPKERPAASVAAAKASDPATSPTESPGPGATGRTSPRPRMPIRWTWDRNPFLSSDSPGGSAGTGGATGSGQPAKEPKGLSDLRGTVITGSSGIAIFGDRLVPTGGKIDGWTVVKVDPYAVSLRRGGEARQVEMFKPAP